MAGDPPMLNNHCPSCTSRSFNESFTGQYVPTTVLLNNKNFHIDDINSASHVRVVLRKRSLQSIPLMTIDVVGIKNRKCNNFSFFSNPWMPYYRSLEEVFWTEPKSLRS